MTKLLTTSLSGAALALATLAGTPVHARDTYLGEVFTMASNFCPRGSLPADGQLLSISQNTALFSLLGTTYGGNGRTTFALPNLQGKLAANTADGNLAPVRYCIATQGIFPSRP